MATSLSLSMIGENETMVSRVVRKAYETDEEKMERRRREAADHGATLQAIHQIEFEKSIYAANYEFKGEGDVPKTS